MAERASRCARLGMRSVAEGAAARDPEWEASQREQLSAESPCIKVQERQQNRMVRAFDSDIMTSCWDTLTVCMALFCACCRLQFCSSDVVLEIPEKG